MYIYICVYIHIRKFTGEGRGGGEEGAEEAEGGVVPGVEAQRGAERRFGARGVAPYRRRAFDARTPARV